MTQKLLTVNTLAVPLPCLVLEATQLVLLLKKKKQKLENKKKGLNDLYPGSKIFNIFYQGLFFFVSKIFSLFP